MVEPGEYASGAAEGSLEAGSAAGIEVVTDSAMTENRRTTWKSVIKRN